MKKKKEIKKKVLGLMGDGGNDAFRLLKNRKEEYVVATNNVAWVSEAIEKGIRLAGRLGARAIVKFECNGIKFKMHSDSDSNFMFEEFRKLVRLNKEKGFVGPCPKLLLQKRDGKNMSD
ncbi:MAG: hypothetical protein UT90_C0010G0022 [Parcubacteria group bacterium GW2011_GWA1_40_21]|nr:MAG: hypothetical protein UT90_C0010G0022 [Parcubacteria group bacterium GW2011_GWA1_40_21]